MRDMRRIEALRPMGAGLRGLLVGALFAAGLAAGCQDQPAGEAHAGERAHAGPPTAVALSADRGRAGLADPLRPSGHRALAVDRPTRAWG